MCIPGKEEINRYFKVKYNHEFMKKEVDYSSVIVILLSLSFFGRGVAQFGQSAAFGTQRSQVQILSPRF